MTSATRVPTTQATAPAAAPAAPATSTDSAKSADSEDVTTLKSTINDLSEKLETLVTLRPHVEDLQWCESIVFVYPTWWSGQPAILKGWIDRILMNQVAWVLPEGAARIKPLLTQIRRIVVVTTHGSSKLVNALQGESGKRTMFRSVRLMMHRRTRCSWIAMYGLDNATNADRKRFTETVIRRTRRAFS